MVCAYIHSGAPNQQRQSDPPAQCDSHKIQGLTQCICGQFLVACTRHLISCPTTPRSNVGSFGCVSRPVAQAFDTR